MINPDFCKIADAYGIPTIRVGSWDEMEEALQWARAEGGPVSSSSSSRSTTWWPMVPSGATLNEMIRRPAARSGVIDAVKTRRPRACTKQPGVLYRVANLFAVATSTSTA